MRPTQGNDRQGTCGLGDVFAVAIEAEDYPIRGTGLASEFGEEALAGVAAWGDGSDEDEDARHRPDLRPPCSTTEVVLKWRQGVAARLASWRLLRVSLNR